MTKVLVLYYSSYGHVETMANAVAEGAKAAGATVDIKRVPEIVPEAIAKASHFKLDQAAPVAKVEELANYDAIVVGAPTRFGRMPSAMGSFWEQAGGLWMTGALHGKVGGAFTSSATQHGGNETTLFSIITNLMHFGMVIVGLPYSHAGQMTLDEIVGGAPYGATTIAGGQGQRQPSAIELDGARHQGAADRQDRGEARGLERDEIGCASLPSPCRFAASLSRWERGDPLPLGGKVAGDSRPDEGKPGNSIPSHLQTDPRLRPARPSTTAARRHKKGSSK